jgi:hypothetical protein
MKASIFVLISIILCGCFPIQMLSYEPVDESVRVVQIYRGLTSISYRKIFDNSSGLSISAGSRDKNEFKIYFQLSVAKKSHIKINEWNFQLSSENWNNDLIIPIDKMSTSVYGRNGNAGHIKYVEPGYVFFGEALNQEFDQSSTDDYTVTLSVKRPMPENLSILIPTFTVNQKLIKTKPVSFKLKSHYDYGYSMQ